MIIKNNDMRLIVIGEIKLLPGFNDVNTDLFIEYTEKEVVGKGKAKVPLYDLDHLFISEKLKKITEVKNEKEEIEFKNFSMSLKETIVNNTYNIKTLESWRKTEENVSVKILIEDRLKDIKNNKINDVDKYGKPSNHT